MDRWCIDTTKSKVIHRLCGAELTRLHRGLRGLGVMEWSVVRRNTCLVDQRAFFAGAEVHRFFQTSNP